MSEEKSRRGRDQRRGLSRYVVPHSSYRWFVRSTVAGALLSAIILGLSLLAYSRYKMHTLAASGALEDDFFRRMITSYTSDLLQLTLLAFGLFVVFMMLLAGYLFHKVAGPIYRLNMYLERALAEGDSGEVRFRDGDQLQDVAKLVNRVVAKERT